MTEPGRPETIADGVRRILAPNPSFMTDRGTNTYLVGAGDVAVIDPGPADAAHMAAILAALSPGERVRFIVVTHAHRDHSELAPLLSQATGAAVVAFGDAQSGRSALMSALASRDSTAPGEGTDHTFRPDRTLADGETLACGDWSLRALHTPGHFGNHLCLGLREIIFSGDHVMGWSTSVVAPPDGDMGAYMTSLDRLAAEPARRLLPGHGAPVEDPAGRIAELIAHRRSRAAAILAELRSAPATAEALARRIYTETPEVLQPAAARNVFAHLVDFMQKNIAEPLGPISIGTKFRAI
jgi:hydroxyacylglutathione hydrolase